MKILVIGSGGREHALTWKITRSPRVTSVWCAPGNAGTADEQTLTGDRPVENIPIGAEDIDTLLSFAQERRPDLTVVGPDNPLTLGITDRFQRHGLRIWGPDQKAARFESSKIFSHQFMIRHGIPCAQGAFFSDPKEAKAYARHLRGQCVVKADGLALGKGVSVCESIPEADEAITALLEKKVFGEAGERLLVQERLSGREVSLHALCDGTRYRLFPPSQDHKRAYEGNRGPNTGGMGTYSPTPFFSPDQMAQVQQEILDPWLTGCQKEGIAFRGMLYPGLMLTAEGPKVLEFNARLGDPETQVYLRRFRGDLIDILEASVDGKLDSVQPEWDDNAAVCVVIAADGYPGTYAKGKPVAGLAEAEAIPGVKIFHAGTRREDSGIVNSGGRILGVTAMGPTLTDALNTAYSAAERIRIEGSFYRSDIGTDALT